ncbi:MAG: OmpA family protein [Kofleriaceae bacterium]
MRRIHILSVLAGLAIAGCGSKPAPVQPAAEPPAPEAAPAEPEAEPETEPVVAQEPKNLEIQRNVIRLKPGIRILFKTDSAELESASNEILDEVASVMDQNARIRVRVEGHTDDVGKPEYNQDLSTRRAASVKAYLATKGIAEERLESTGCGQVVPIADNKTDDGKQQNRRVEFVILRKRRVVEPCQVYKPREHRRDRGQSGGEAPAAPATTP